MKRRILDAWYFFDRKDLVARLEWVIKMAIPPRYAVESRKVVALVRDTDIRDDDVIFEMMRVALNEDFSKLYDKTGVPV